MNRKLQFSQKTSSYFGRGCERLKECSFNINLIRIILSELDKIVNLVREGVHCYFKIIISKIHHFAQNKNNETDLKLIQNHII